MNHPENDCWPFSSGEMGVRIREFAAGSNPWGPPETWPQRLRSAIELMLPCGFPMIILWGPDLIQIYNDQYRSLMGRKHPSGFGRPTEECWPEVWHINQPIYEKVWNGETLTFEDALYPLARSGAIEDAWFTLTYSPLRDEGGMIAGILVTLFETTGRKQAEQRRSEAEAALKASEQRQSFLLRLADALRQIRNPIDVQNVAARVLGQHLHANRVAYAEDGGDGETVILARNYTDGVPGIEGTYRYSDYGDELIRTLRAGRPMVRPDIANDPQLSEAEKLAHATLQLAATLNVPLLKDGHLVAILAVHYAVPHQFTAEEISLALETAERTWSAIEAARAEAALHESEERLRVMVDELKHRTRNLLAIIQSIATQTAKLSDNLEDFQARFGERLIALGKTQDLLSKTDDTEITIKSLLFAELDALCSPGLGVTIDISGPDIKMRNSAVQTLALAIHELATNARKYGALGASGGQLAVHWYIQDPGSGRPTLRFEWSEKGQKVTASAREKRGYGRNLVERAMPLAFGGTTEYALTPEGLHCVFSIPLSKVLKANSKTAA